MFDDQVGPPHCPTCGSEFVPKTRKDQRYCKRACQKNATQGSRKTGDNAVERRRSHIHFDRARWLAHDLYTKAPNQRLGFMADIIEAARTQDAQLRSILTDPRLLGASPTERGLFFRKCPTSYDTIAQAADLYCRRFWGHGVRAVVFNRCAEPETGEVA